MVFVNPITYGTAPYYFTSSVYFYVLQNVWIWSYIIRKRAYIHLYIGKGLMEIVTEPDLHSGNEAAAFVNELQLLLKTLSTGDG